MKQSIQKLLFAIFAAFAGIAFFETIRAANFAQRYGTNSYITTHPLYFKKIDDRGRIIRMEHTKHPRREERKMRNEHKKMKNGKKKMKHMVKRDQVQRNATNIKKM
ncbi:hypothetical protein KC460_01425 [Candidatus Dependentiae bacterium]|nr:hypothetical protein [Candidatus Dependentiae bacterium]